MGSGDLSSAALPRGFFDRPSHEVAPDLLGRVLVHGPVAVRLTEVEAYGGPGEDPAAHTYRGKTPRNAVMFGPPGHLYVYFTYGMHFCANLVCLPEGFGSAVLLRAGEVVAGIDEARARRTSTGSGRTSTGSGRTSTGNGRTSTGNGRTSTGNGPAPTGSDPASTGNGSSAARPASGRAIPDRDLARGPARLAVALGLLREHNGLDAIAGASFVADRRLTGVPHGAAVMLEGRPAEAESIRSGPRTGISTAKDTPWRFWIDGDPTVSPYRAHVPRRRNAAATSVGGASRS
ncbi:DNA-3-methyladenine glycosylase [Nonomuraea jabiensis]|uniref:DNA-3-methyladenine glycosylase n=1 Tax=Nonomuraea jabiensis TaxID=882448 RepID=UPI003D7238C5